MEPIKKNCAICRKEFEDITRNHHGRYCSKKCYLVSQKEKMKEYWANHKPKKEFPKWVCPKCGKLHQLKFYPETKYWMFERLIARCCKS